MRLAKDIWNFRFQIRLSKSSFVSDEALVVKPLTQGAAGSCNITMNEEGLINSGLRTERKYGITEHNVSDRTLVQRGISFWEAD